MTKQAATFFDPAKTFYDNFDNGPFLAQKEPYKNEGVPQYEFLGHKLYSPFGIAAGSLPTSQHVAGAFHRGFDVVCYKTQRSVEFPVNDFPNVVYLDVEGDLTLEQAKQGLIGSLESDKPVEQTTITNSFGNPSKGPGFWVEDMKKAVAAQGKGQLMIASVVGTIQDGFSPDDYYDDFAAAAELASKAGAPVIEVNLSCPNVASEGVICYTYDAVIAIAEKVRAKVGDKPVIAKLGYFTDEQQGLLEKILTNTKDYFNAYSVINTLQAPVYDKNGNQMLPGEGRLSAGVCGRGIKWAGLDMVKRLDDFRKKNRFDYQIIGVGGVMTPKDFHDYRSAGADVVQSVTAAMWNDNLAAEIKATLQ